MLKFILSPAKKIYSGTEYPYINNTQPQFLDKTDELVKEMQRKSIGDIKKLMGVSDKIVQLNYERFQNWDFDNKKHKHTSIFMFDGDVYNHLKARIMSDVELVELGKRAYILSGLYGILRAFDTIQPYRLEMGLPLKIENSPNLVAYWKKDVTEFLNKELEKNNTLVNLTSSEYGNAVNWNDLKAPSVNVLFKNLRKDKYSNIGLMAKRARGMFARYIVQKQPQQISDLKEFNEAGYVFYEQDSNKKQLVFLSNQ